MECSQALLKHMETIKREDIGILALVMCHSFIGIQEKKFGY